MSIGIYAKMAELTHLCTIYFPILINWTSPFPILGLLGGIFHFYSNFKRNFCKQIEENLIRHCILRCLIWLCTVCRCPMKRRLGFYGLTLSIVCSFTRQIRLLSIMINFELLSPANFI